jgi:hypothetical protein
MVQAFFTFVVCDALPIWLRLPVSFRQKPAKGTHAFIMIWTIRLAFHVYAILEGEM